MKNNSKEVLAQFVASPDSFRRVSRNLKEQERKRKKAKERSYRDFNN